MHRTFKDIFIVNQIVRRRSLTHYYWPVEYKNPDREHLIENRKWYEGWYCEFCDSGLELKIKFFLTEQQMEHWPKELGPNKNIKCSDTMRFHDFVLHLPLPTIQFQHSSRQFEFVRKGIYVVEKFQEKADGLWASQFYLDDTHDSKVQYALGFTRSLDDQDRKHVNVITSQIESWEL